MRGDSYFQHRILSFSLWDPDQTYGSYIPLMHNIVHDEARKDLSQPNLRLRSQKPLFSSQKKLTLSSNAPTCPQDLSKTNIMLPRLVMVQNYLINLCNLHGRRIDNSIEALADQPESANWPLDRFLQSIRSHLEGSFNQAFMGIKLKIFAGFKLE